MKRKRKQRAIYAFDEEWDFVTRAAELSGKKVTAYAIEELVKKAKRDLKK